MLVLAMRGGLGLVLLALAGYVLAQSANPRYVIRGETVYDQKTNLTWARCSVGQTWKDGSGCVGEISQMPWDEALRCEQNGWRLPTKDELIVLVDPIPDPMPKVGEELSKNDEAARPDMGVVPIYYWTNTHWKVKLGVGGFATKSSLRSITHSVRLVRDGP